MATKKVMLGTTYNKTKQYKRDVARKRNKTERAKTEVLGAVSGGKNISGRSATTRKKRINKMFVHNKNISQTIQNVQTSRGRAAVALRIMRKQQQQVNSIRKRLGQSVVISKKRSGKK